MEQSGCAMDIIFVLDDSFSVAADADASAGDAEGAGERGYAYRAQRDFFRRIVGILPEVSEGSARVAAISVSTDATLLFDFDDNGFGRAAIADAVLDDCGGLSYLPVRDLC